MGKNGVDGVYTADPRTDPDAVKLDHADLHRGPAAAASGGRRARRSACAWTTTLPMLVFGLEGEGNVARALRGEKIGTLVTAS